MENEAAGTETDIVGSTSESTEEIDKSDNAELEVPVEENTEAVEKEFIMPTNCLAAGLDMPEVLKDYECYFNWIEKDFDEKEAGFCFLIAKMKIKKILSDQVKLNESSSESDTEDAVEDIEDSDESESEEEDIDDDDDDPEEDEELVYLNCEVAFLLGYIGQYDRAQSYLSSARSNVDSRDSQDEMNFTDEFVEGFDYIYDGLQAFIIAMMGNIPSEDETRTLKNFSSLPLKVQVAVLKFKLNFQCSRKQFISRLEVYKQLALLQPQVPSWHYYMHFYLRITRRHASLCSSPTEEETAAIIRARELRPNEPIFKLAGCINLGETLKNMSDFDLNSRIFRVNYGDICFKSPENIVEYMRKLAKSLLELPEEAEKEGNWYCDLAELFSTSLPKRFYDFNLAHDCIKKAVLLSPNNTRIHHRMAIFQLKAFRNLQLAEEHLQLAMKKQSLNFFAFVDFVQVLMAKPEVNESKINEFFEVNLTKSHIWSPNEMSRLYFVKGCFLVMMKKSMEDVIKCWLEAYKIRPNADYFNTVGITMWRFFWPQGEFNLKIAQDIILRAIKDSALKEMEIDLLKDRLSEVEVQLKLGNTNWRLPRNDFGRNSSQQQNQQNDSEGSWRSSSSTANSAFNQNAYRRRTYSANPDPMEENWRVRK